MPLPRAAWTTRTERAGQRGAGRGGRQRAGRFGATPRLREGIRDAKEQGAEGVGIRDAKEQEIRGQSG